MASLRSVAMLLYSDELWSSDFSSRSHTPLQHWLKSIPSSGSSCNHLQRVVHLRRHEESVNSGLKQVFFSGVQSLPCQGENP